MTDAELTMAKAIQWEIAKGHLRAVAAIEGHRRLTTIVTTSSQLIHCQKRWERVSLAFEQFIDKMENDGLSE